MFHLFQLKESQKGSKGCSDLKSYTGRRTGRVNMRLNSPSKYQQTVKRGKQQQKATCKPVPWGTKKGWQCWQCLNWRSKQILGRAISLFLRHEKNGLARCHIRSKDFLRSDLLVLWSCKLQRKESMLLCSKLRVYVFK